MVTPNQNVVELIFTASKQVELNIFKYMIRGFGEMYLN